MAIVLARIDGRLIHGQVAMPWTKAVQAEKIVVIDDQAANDEVQKMMLEFGAPSSVIVEIYNNKEGVDALKSGTAENHRTMIVVRGPDTMLYLIKQGISLEEINVGGMYYEEGKEQFEKALYVNKYEIEIFKKIKELQVPMYYQIAPLNKRHDLFSIISE
ncbi:PTS system mannose/fructose/N-acetylgalactosamine-transporter subunit IIB [Bacillus salipaludis]|uniref:PTS system mannose/fructose/N-acetylgalactosamine-transporter subunit IIB n=1 Tax=Bacillus salipaludis TaxID=2547811 RepID=A0ABW8RK81_9BACI